MTPIDQLALEAAKALSEKYCIDGHDAATPPDQELADLLAPFLRRAVEMGAEQFVPKFVATPSSMDEDYAKFVESVVHLCHCSERHRPCDGVLAGGLCDNQQDEWDDDGRATD